MTRTTPAPVQLPPELRRLVDDVTAVLMTAADPVAAAHQFVSLFDEALVGLVDERAREAGVGR